MTKRKCVSFVESQGHWAQDCALFKDCEVQVNCTCCNCLQEGHQLYKCKTTTGMQVHYVRSMTNRKAFFEAKNKNRPLVPVMFPPGYQGKYAPRNRV